LACPENTASQAKAGEDAYVQAYNGCLMGRDVSQGDIATP